MKFTLADLTESRNAKLTEFMAVADKAATENRAHLNEAEVTRSNEIEAEIKGIDANIDLLKRQQAMSAGQEALTAEQRAIAGTKPNPNVDTTTTTGAKDPVFRNFGEQLIAIRAMATPGAFDVRAMEQHANKLKEVQTRAALGANIYTPADGGFLVQSDFSTEILKRANETGVLMSKVRKVPIGANSNGIKIPVIDEQSRVDGSRWGGIQMFWVNEAESVNQKKPKIRMLGLKIKKLRGLYYATEEVEMMAEAMTAIALQGFGEETGYMTDTAIWAGGGAIDPMGITKGGAVVSISRSGQGAGTFLYDNLLHMEQAIAPSSKKKKSTQYFANQELELQLAKMFLTVGTISYPVYYPANTGPNGNDYATLYGRPLNWIEQASAPGTTGDIALIDTQEYVTIDKGAPETASSIHVAFLTGETAYRITLFMDGQPIWNTPLTPAKGTVAKSPYVLCGTAS